MILLDTCTLLWLVMEPDSLSAEAKIALHQNRGDLFVSSVNAFEIGQKFNAGKLELPLPPSQWFDLACRLHGLIIHPLRSIHAFRAAELPLLHRDPFDRLLIGTAIVEDLVLLTPDPKIHQYAEASVRW
jgi:PIN domain nuclease of toxin-antitoxin system